MALDKVLKIYDENGNPVDYDILASDVKFLPDGKDLPTKLAEMQDEIDDAGQGDGTVTGVKIGSTTYDPTDGVVDLSSPMSNKVDKETGKGLSTNDYTDADKAKVGSLPTNPVQTVSVNGGTPQTPVNGNVDISVEETAGEDGITPHIDAVTGNWFIGDENTGVPATGPQGNSGVASGDEVVVVNDLDGEPSDLESGQVAVLSAEQGKYLGDRTLIETGLFGDAYDKAMQLNVPFPWLLDDTDDQGNKVKKMIWHAGNGIFIDAIGGDVSGDRNGLTVECLGPCLMRVIAFNPSSRTDQTKYKDYQLQKGINNFPLSTVGKVTINSTDYTIINTIKFFPSSDDTSAECTDKVKKIDFGGLRLFITGDFATLLKGQEELTTIKRLVLDNSEDTEAWKIKPQQVLANCPKLNYLDVSGSLLSTGASENSYKNLLAGKNSLVKLDLSKLKIQSKTLSYMLGANVNDSPLTEANLAGIDFGEVTLLHHFCYGKTSLTKLIVGNFSNASCTGAVNMLKMTGSISTLVVTTKYPPSMSGSIDFLGVLASQNSSVFGTAKGKILVPPGSLQDYTSATGWSDYAAIIEEFNEGDYTVIDNTPNP